MVNKTSTRVLLFAGTPSVAQSDQWRKGAGLAGARAWVRDESRDCDFTLRRGRNPVHIRQVERIVPILPTVSGGCARGAGFERPAQARLNAGSASSLVVVLPGEQGPNRQLPINSKNTI